MQLCVIKFKYGGTKQQNGHGTDDLEFDCTLLTIAAGAMFSISNSEKDHVDVLGFSSALPPPAVGFIKDL